MRTLHGIYDMSSDGLFNLGLQSIEWQLKNLFSDCGGDSAIELLNKLSQLSAGEREILLSHFKTLTQKISEGSVRLNDPEDAQAAQLEQALYQDIVKEIDETRTRQRLQVVPGGLSRVKQRGLIDFNSAKRRKIGETTKLN